MPSGRQCRAFALERPVSSRSWRWIAALIGIASAAALVPTTTPAQRATTEIDIADMEAGAPPAGFTFWTTGGGAPGNWLVLKDPTSAAGQAIVQTSKGPTDYRFPLAIYKPVSAKNVDVLVHFKLVSGEVDQAGGIAVRLRTPDDYYVLRANALENNVRFCRLVRGEREQIRGVDTKVIPQEWHTLRLRAEGSWFTVSFDGEQLFAIEDNTFAEPGKVALWTKADSVTHFDQIALTALE
jgi:hypothetical protein